MVTTALSPETSVTTASLTDHVLPASAASVVKLRVVSSAIPAYELPYKSSTAVASI